MIVYRGTPKPEGKPRPREYAAVFFAPNIEYASEYGKFVQKYDVGRQRILNFGGPSSRKVVFAFTGRRPARDHNDEEEMGLFWHPTKEWVRFVMKAGYTGTAFGSDVCIFDLSKIKLLDQWLVEWKGRRLYVEPLR